MKCVDNKTPQVEFDNINALIMAGMSTNKAEPFKMNGYGAIDANDKATNNFYIVRFTSVRYKIQEDVE